MLISITIQNGYSFSIAYTYDSLQGMMHLTKKAALENNYPDLYRYSKPTRTRRLSTLNKLSIVKAVNYSTVIT